MEILSNEETAERYKGYRLGFPAIPRSQLEGYMNAIRDAPVNLHEYFLERRSFKDFQAKGFGDTLKLDLRNTFLKLERDVDEVA